MVNTHIYIRRERKRRERERPDGRVAQMRKGKYREECKQWKKRAK